MTSRLRQLTERAEKLQREREAHRAMLQGIKRQEIADLLTESEGIDFVIEVSRGLHAGDEDYLPRLAEALEAAEARHDAGERVRGAEEAARRTIEAEARLRSRQDHPPPL